MLQGSTSLKTLLVRLRLKPAEEPALSKRSAPKGGQVTLSAATGAKPLFYTGVHWKGNAHGKSKIIDHKGREGTRRNGILYSSEKIESDASRICGILDSVLAIGMGLWDYN